MPPSLIELSLHIQLSRDVEVYNSRTFVIQLRTRDQSPIDGLERVPQF